MNNQQGFNLVELMVALTLGTLVFLVLGQIFVSMWRTNQTQTALRDLHSGGVYGLDALEREVRQAGFAGCLGDFDEIRNVPNSTTAPDSVVWGEEEDGTDTRYNVAGDRFRIRYLEPIWKDVNMRLQQTIAGASGSSLTLPTGDSVNLENNDMIVVHNCVNADYAVLTSTPASTATQLNINRSINGNDYLSGNTNLYRHRYIEYFVREVDGLQSLFSDDLGLAEGGGAIPSTPLIRDIKRMDVLYGEDTGGSSTPDVYRKEEDVVNWDNIRALRIILHVHDPTRDLCGGINDPAPSECQYQTTILLRNRL